MGWKLSRESMDQILADPSTRVGKSVRLPDMPVTPTAPVLPSSAQLLAAYTSEPLRYLNEIPQAPIVVRAVHLGEPVVKKRPRVLRNGHVYTPKSTRNQEAAIGALARATLGLVPADAQSIFGVRAVFYLRTRRPKDCDNLLKVVLDGLNQVVYADDSQVRELMGWCVLDRQRPRTELLVYRLQIM